MKRSDVTIPIRGTKDSWPRDSAGDPSFRDLADLHQLFSDVQIVTMCNRYLRQQEYQDGASTAYQLRQREARRLLREKP